MIETNDQALIVALRGVIPPGDAAVPLHEPEFAGREWDFLKECLDSGWVSSSGPFVDGFERVLAERCGVKHAIATVNGTAALHAALLGAGVTCDDEVLVPALTFAATANAVSYIGAVPHFVDSDPDRLGISPRKIEAYLDKVSQVSEGGGVLACQNKDTGRRIKAVMPMHVFGHPVDMDGIMSVAKRFGLAVVEDAAGALGSRYKDRPAGSLGDVGALSFNGNKIVTTGGGGAVLCDDDALADQLRHLCTTAKLSHPWAFEHDRIGFNYRLPNLNAAIGCAQMEQLDGLLARKRRLADEYGDALSGVPGFSMITAPKDSESNFWLNAVRIEGPADRGRRDALLDALNGAGLLCRPAWEPMHRLQMYRNCPRMDLAVVEDLADRLINIPSGPALRPA
jgi:perosamine synthetase